MNRVIFRKFREGDVIALFQDQPMNDRGYFINSYQHIGQHSAACRDVVYNTVPATPAEYASLLAELVSIGYDDLVIRKRFSRK